MRTVPLAILALFLAGCAPSPAPVNTVITPRVYSVPEQVEINAERMVVTYQTLYVRKDGKYEAADLHMLPMVIDDWRDMRAALRAAR